MSTSLKFEVRSLGSGNPIASFIFAEDAFKYRAYRLAIEGPHGPGYDVVDLKGVPQKDPHNLVAVVAIKDGQESVTYMRREAPDTNPIDSEAKADLEMLLYRVMTVLNTYKHKDKTPWVTVKHELDRAIREAKRSRHLAPAAVPVLEFALEAMIMVDCGRINEDSIFTAKVEVLNLIQRRRPLFA